MPAIKEHPRYNVISMRISDDEKAALQQVTRITNKSISHILREALFQVTGNVESHDSPFSKDMTA
jgi:predicted transcriptional regulator